MGTHKHMETMQCLGCGYDTPTTMHTKQDCPIFGTSAHQAQDLAGGEELPGGREVHALRRHAVQAA
jgi:hypothetical protein